MLYRPLSVNSMFTFENILSHLTPVSEVLLNQIKQITQCYLKAHFEQFPKKKKEEAISLKIK